MKIPKMIRFLVCILLISNTAIIIIFGGCSKESNYQIYEERAWNMMRQEDWDEKISTDILSNLNAAIQLAPDHVKTDTYRLRANCWDRIGDKEKALADRLVVIAREPNNPSNAKVYCIVAGIMGERKELQQALKYIDKAIDLAPDYPVARAIRALIYRDMGLSGKMEDELRIVAQLDPELTNTVNFQYKGVTQ